MEMQKYALQLFEKAKKNKVNVVFDYLFYPKIKSKKFKLKRKINFFN